MKIAHPSDSQISALRELWKEAFGDSDDFLDLFFRTAYSPLRCRCVETDGAVAAVLYWFDCALKEQKLAYVYAVATSRKFRGQGLCRALMTDTHDYLRQQGYSSAVLVPQSEGLRAMYAGMGYRDAGGRSVFSCTAGDSSADVRAIGPGEFAALRRTMLPEMSVIQEGENLTFLASQMQFYHARGCLMAAWSEAGTLHAAEYLGDPAAAPGILKALGCSRGDFHGPGTSPFAMWHPLNDHAYMPEYFGFAFD